jgi:D-serine deaminase-like pyridoxal phosphate-dependent protein
VAPESPAVLEIARLLHDSPGVEFAGVLTHAGNSYHCSSVAEIKAVAEAERCGVVQAATRIRGAGLPCPTVSAGSTPTAIHAVDLTGVTEMRPGTYVFFDLAQVGMGSCQMDDLAVSVLATVIGRSHQSNSLLVDAGSLALSSDTSASEHFPGVGYGLVCDLAGRLLPGLRVTRINQEHGYVERETPIPPNAFPIGTRLRILPNHSCITAAMFNEYQVVDVGLEIVAIWPRARGW